MARPCSLLSSTKLVSLPRPVSMAEPGDRRQIGTGDQHHIGAVDGERAAGDGTCDHARQVEHANSRKRTIALGPGFWRGVADLLDRDQRQGGKRLGMRRCRPFVMRAHESDDTAAGIGRGLERLAIPLHQRGLDVFALRLAVQHLADGVTVMPEIGMQPHEALIAGFVNSGSRVPGRRRRLAVDAQIALASAFDDGMAHIDRNVLRLPAAQFPDLRSRKSRRGDAGLRRRRDAKRGRQLRLFTGQLDRVERGSLAAGRRPDIAENFSGALHARFSFFVSRP